tara:strand:- start:6137 stop:7891 length:1755 start_codon:yes stop_codon:yes gene_type:complete
MSLKNRIRTFWIATLLAVGALGYSLKAYEMMPIEEIKPGMEGEWRTVISGTEVETFPLRVIGVAGHFVGPDQPVIICEAIDEKNVLSGPVAGMSGSPVFIEGKLVGAYAYGYSWPKEQAIIGVTPIHNMLPVFENKDIEVASSGTINPHWKSVELTSRDRLGEYKSVLKPLPAPLIAAGISDQTLQAFQEEFDKLGIQVMNGPGGSSMKELTGSIEAGSAVSAILMQGDFNFGATGTVTHIEGDQLLAFGHPFFQWGNVEMPLAQAEILTIVRSLPASFKLSNTGGMVGRVYQDRLTGIAAEIGQVSPMTDYSVSVEYPNFDDKNYSAKIFRHPRLSPVIGAMATMEALRGVLEYSEEQTLRVKTRVKIEGYEPIEVTDVFAGTGVESASAFQQMAIHQLISDNTFDSPPIESMEVEVEASPVTEIIYLEAVYLHQDTALAGETVNLTLQMKNHQGKRFSKEVAFKLPEEVRKERVELLVADALAVDKVEFEGFYTASNFEHILERIADLKSRDHIYVCLLRRSPGISLEGQHLAGLPPSTLTLLKNVKGLKIDKDTLRESTFEMSIPVDAEFRGSAILPLTVD